MTKNRPAGEVWVTGRVVRRTRRCVSFRALDTRDRERTCHLPLVHLRAEREAGEDKRQLRVPLWWAFQEKLQINDHEGHTRVVYGVATDPTIAQLTDELLERSLRRVA